MMQLIFPQPECEPRTIRIEDYPKATSKCSFYDGLQRLSSVAPPRFKGDHMLMCDERAVLDLWNYCLPITARKDLFCRNADRNDILNIPPRRQLCYASVLHLLTADVYDVFRSVGGKPVLLYGTLLGAVRNASIISYTEDTDIGFQMNGYHRDQVLNELRNRGYHVFPQGIWRVCVAPTHPLASKLYDPSRRLTEAYSVPYADLYAMAPMMTAMGAVLGWHVQEVRDDRPIPEPQFQPYSQVTLNGLEYDTLAAPIDFLVHEYGEDYLRPKRPLPSCEPITIRVEDYPEATSKHSFNDAVRRAGNIPAPRFRGNHTVLCQQAQADSKILWSSCLPITARNYIFCHQADRNDIVTMPSRQQLCYASVLHLLTADVYDVFRSVGAKPVLLYGSLLGAKTRTSASRLAGPVAEGSNTNSIEPSFTNDSTTPEGSSTDIDLGTSPTPTPTSSLPRSLRPGTCLPSTINAKALNAGKDHPDRFYTLLEEVGSYPPPELSGQHRIMCDERQRTNLNWKYCLPITGRIDEPFCNAADRVDLLLPQSKKLLCQASIVHMILLEAYDLLQQFGAQPAVLYGTLLGAVRNASIIPFTEDADVGYVKEGYDWNALREAFWDRGFHLFEATIWRVCIAPTHPLASNLYNPDKGLSACCNIPYVDLYRMQPEQNENTTEWRVEKIRKGRRVPADKFQPYSQVLINGRPFNTVRDPVDFLVDEYGKDYMPPTEPPTELPTSPPTPAPTEPPTAVPTELPTEPPTEAPTEPPTAAPTVAPTPPAEPSCSPETIDVHSIPLSSRTPRDRFYAMLDERGSFPPPVFKKSHMDLCASNGHTYRAWDYCLPITGRKDEPYCTGADRNDLLVPHTSGTRCHASILHLLLTDVYDAFQELGGKPALLYGTLLGAIRNSAVIAFTEAIDIGYQFREHELGTVKQYLWERGYHLFKENIYRVCIAPTHPLASNLYNPDKGHSACCNIPYVDLYRMSPESNGAMWRVEETNHGRRIPDSKLQPYTQVKINGAEFDTVADTTDFLLAEYGRDYMVPKPRRSIR
ncbi:TPA: hypothetical protein N0F65_005071 [Lagenidium giganteum]|uniref:Uncharacterized protein n=1 Tax=Lagenidium giganteum TaxID=4803 RepID=A0AAV2ZH64_9STRA|nr:TPA: hypothetical protein N0F65_005071 [Lagenidium giganteum]